MLQPPLYFPSGRGFWDAVTDVVVQAGRVDYAALRVVVPTMDHIHALQDALVRRIGRPFIPPRICTLSGWLAMQAPTSAAADSERLMALYAELRQHAWLKKLFTARSNTDLLPLAQTLLTLCDELSLALLPDMARQGDDVAARWQAALAQLSPAARSLLSNEAQLVWSVWQTQLDGRDPQAVRFAQMMALASRADGPLIWVTPIEAAPFDQAFLARYAQQQSVHIISLDWRVGQVAPVYAAAWPELFDLPAETALARVLDGTKGDTARDTAREPIADHALCESGSLEEQATQGAQTIIDWLLAGKSSVAIIAQDRVVARRLRALLERAAVHVADETGWKLSTTRAAAALAAWFDVITTKADTVALLDFLKSPFVLAELADKSALVLEIELALRRANVSGGWPAVQAALANASSAQLLVAQCAREAGRFRGRRRLHEWANETGELLDAMHMRTALSADTAGEQVLAMLADLAQDCAALEQTYSFAEWRALINLQLESLPFVQASNDQRVVMLPLNGARLRHFDAVLVVGADAAHLPSQPQETLFFANAVRRELGLATRESRQRQQLRDLVELLQANPQVVLCWQSHKDGEPNPVSPWIARLEHCLLNAGAPPMKRHVVARTQRSVTAQLATCPMPSAAALRPQRLSASGFNSLVACPYQFFATRMLGLSVIDDLSDLPEKRDYGDWLHKILHQYHEALRENPRPEDQRAALLQQISAAVFDPELEKNAGALGFAIRWQQAAPAYLTWANSRQVQGWTYAAGEYALEANLDLPDGGSLTLHGRIDRVDEHIDGERAVLDYKTTDLDVLRKRMKDREDQQLAFYGILSAASEAVKPVQHAPIQYGHYVALEIKNGKTGDLPAPNYTEWQSALRLQVIATLSAIGQGAGLPANGINTVCRFCDMRGLCRKGVW